jgi:hypothetical protein
MTDVIMGFFFQIAATVGVIALFGFIISLLRRGFCALAPKNGPRILLFTGIVGTPIHELSHALMCLVFGHKITEIKLYEPNSQDGTLGHVSHSYNKKNIYHQIGNFFIGTAPVLLGGAFILLLMALLTPSSYEAVTVGIEGLSFIGFTDFTVGEYFEFVWGSIIAVFSSDTLSSWQGWMFILLAIMIASHMEMSGADIKNSSLGFLFLAILLLLVDGVVYLISPEALESMNSASAYIGLILSAFLSVSVLFLLGLVILGLFFKGIAAIFKR